MTFIIGRDYAEFQILKKGKWPLTCRHFSVSWLFNLNRNAVQMIEVVEFGE